MRATLREPRLGHVLAAVAGVVALVAVARWVGADAVGERLGAALAWLPLLLLLEGLRIPLEGLATRRLLGPLAERVPLALLARAQLVFYAASTCAPGGRLVAEASKAALLGGTVGVARASALATASQAASLVADALVAALGAGAVYSLCGMTRLTALTLVFAFACASFAALVAAATRSAFTPRLLARVPRVADFLERWRGAARAQRLLDARVVLLLVGARSAQVLLLGAAMAAVGAGFAPQRALALAALVMAGAVVGEAIPAQLGATDAVLVAAAPTLALDPVRAATVAMLFHLVQLAWSVLGALVAALVRVPPRGEPAPLR
jgi:hypothetical protein